MRLRTANTCESGPVPARRLTKAGTGAHIRRLARHH